jgi:hypothetical protein
VYVAAADANGDNLADVISGPGSGMGPEVRVFNANGGAELRRFLAFDAAFTGGVRVAGGDFNGDSAHDVAAAAGPGGGPHVRAFRLSDLTLLADFFAFDAGFRSGLFVAGGAKPNQGTLRQSEELGIASSEPAHVEPASLAQYLAAVDAVFMAEPSADCGCGRKSTIKVAL